MLKWVNRVIRATSSGVCFAPNRDRVGAGNKRRSGPATDVELSLLECSSRPALETIPTGFD
jgi:hypothetical protein